MDSELKTNLLSALRSALTKEGFSFRAAKTSFVRQRGEVTDLFQLVFLDGKPGYRIQPNVGVRIERIENIFHQISGFETKYRKDTATMGCSVGILLDGDARSCEFLLESETEIASVAEKIIAVFHGFALPYFERWASLDAIDAELNNSPGSRSNHRSLAFFRCSTGIIVAKLVGRADFEELANFYTDVMTRDNKGFYLKQFQSLLKLLEKVAPERAGPVSRSTES